MVFVMEASAQQKADGPYINSQIEKGAPYTLVLLTASGAQPGLALDNRNTGKMLFEASILPFDGRFRSRIHGEGFMAREELLSDIHYSGGTVEWNNRVLLDEDGRNRLELTVKAGTSRGEVPVDDYFMLGVRQHTEHFLRGHDTVDGEGHFGHAPMGTSFSLANVTYDRVIRRLPFFNVLNFPYVDLKWVFFVDGARTFDRADVFNEGKFLVDVGGGFRLDTPTGSFNLTYGRSVTDGTGTFSAYLGKQW